MISFSKHKEIMLRYLEAVSEGELVGVLSLFTTDAKVHSPTQSQPKTPQEFYPALLERSKGVQFKAKSFFAGEQPGMASVVFDYCKPGQAAFDCVDIFSFDAKGKIKELWIIFDTKNLAK
jgi:hypothetical protein